MTCARVCRCRQKRISLAGKPCSRRPPPGPSAVDHAQGLESLCASLTPRPPEPQAPSCEVTAAGTSITSAACCHCGCHCEMCGRASGDLAQSALESRLPCRRARVAVVCSAYILLTTLFHHPGVPLSSRLQGRRNGTATLPTLLLKYHHHYHYYYCPRQSPDWSTTRHLPLVRRRPSVHAEYWRRRPLPASLTQTLPLGCLQTAVSV